MTTQLNESRPQEQTDHSPTKAAGHAYLPLGFAALLGVLAVWHFFVDTVACVLTPLWPSLESHLVLPSGQVFWLYVVWSVTTSFGQFVVGLYADRFPSRWLIWVAPLLSVICMSCLGYATSPWTMALLLFLGGLGIAAFHPEAAATAGACLPDHRSRAMSIFALSGYLGQSAGPIYSGSVTDHWGLVGLSSILIWGLAAFCVLVIMSRNVRWPKTMTTGKSATLSIDASTLPVVVMLVTVGTLRVFAALGIPLALAFLLKAREATNSDIGFVQAAFMFGIGAGSLVCAVCLRQYFERVSLWLFPFLAVPLIYFLPNLNGATLILLVALSGACIGITLPLLISYGQRLFPHGQRTASSLTMGVTWGLGGIMLAAMMAVLKQWQHVEWAFIAFAITVTLSGILCFWLPSPRE